MDGINNGCVIGEDKFAISFLLHLHFNETDIEGSIVNDDALFFFRQTAFFQELCHFFVKLRPSRRTCHFLVVDAVDVDDDLRNRALRVNEAV